MFLTSHSLLRFFTMLLWHDMTTLRKGMQAYTCHILQHHHSTTPQPWFKHLFHLALCHQSSRHSCRSCAGKLLEQETKTNAWKIRKLGSNKILEKTACCNHILSGRKSRGMSHLNQTSESLWATINSDVSSRNSTHKRLLGSFLLQSLLNKSTLTVLESRTLHLSLWNRHHFWMLLANMDCNTNKYIYIYILLRHEVDHAVFTEWTRWTLLHNLIEALRSMKWI